MAIIFDFLIRQTDLDFFVTTNAARASDGTRIPSESAIVRAVVAPSVTRNLFALFAFATVTVGVPAGTVVLEVLVMLVGIVVEVVGTVVLVVLVGIVVEVVGTVVLVVLVTEVPAAVHSVDVGINPLSGTPGQPVLPCR